MRELSYDSVAKWAFLGIVVCMGIGAVTVVFGWVDASDTVKVALISSVAAQFLGFVIWKLKQPTGKRRARCTVRDLSGIEHYVYDTIARMVQEGPVTVQKTINYIESHPLKSVTLISVFQQLYSDGIITSEPPATGRQLGADAVIQLLNRAATWTTSDQQ